jgi:O-antigen/teichoic acid export membrane protein
MSLSDFGVFASLLSVTNILSIFIMGISFFLTREFSRMIGEQERVYGLYRSAVVSLFYLGLWLFLIYVLLSPSIGYVLHIESIRLILVTGTVIFISSLSVVYSALFRSMKSFRFLSFTQIFTPVLKIGLWFLLVYLGYSILGALLWLILTGAFIAIISLFYSKSLFSGITPSTTEKFSTLIHRDKKWLLRYITATALFTFFMNADILFAKHFYSPDAAGIYAGVAVLAKFLIFFLLSIETVYYWQIMEHTKKNLPKKLLYEPILIIIVSTIVSLIGAYFVSGYLLTFLKAELEGQENLFLLLIVYSALLALVSFVSKLLIGWEERWVSRILGGGAIAMLVSVLLLRDFSGYFHFLFALGTPLFIVMVLLSILLYRSLSNSKKIW